MIEIAIFFGNWVCWAILALALVCYQQLCLEYLDAKNRANEKDAEHQTIDHQNRNIKQSFSGVLIGALPLLGLLGTIMGLLDSFANIATEGANSDTVSGGIADALLTTQLGLICAIPAWLLQSYIQSYLRKPELSNSIRAELN